MRALLTLGLIGFLSCVATGQDNVNLKEMIGFGCYYAGEPTKTVAKVTKLIQQEKYKDISKLLTSNRRGENYLPIITLQRLADVGRYDLNNSEKELISKAQLSDDSVSVCSGCTYFDQVPIKRMLLEENFIGSNYWLDRVIRGDEELDHD